MSQYDRQSDARPDKTILQTEDKAVVASQPIDYGQALFETMPYGVIWQDADGRIISANPAALLILGNSMDGLESVTWRRLELYWRREDGSPCLWQEQPSLLALQSGEPQRDVVMQVYNWEEKGHRLLNITAVPLFVKGENRPTHVYTLFDDITKRKEKERHQQEECISLILRGVNDVFWDWSQEKNEIIFSQRWWKMLGYAEDEITDEPDPWQRMIDPDDRQRVGQLLGEALDGELDAFEMEYRLRHKLGHRVHVISRIVIFRDAGGKATRICGTNIDLTRRLQTEEALRQYQIKLRVANETLEQRVLERTEELESAIREQEAFSYSVSHDLRAPLRHINSFSAILLEEYGEEIPREGRKYLERIRTASSKMGALIDDLLELSRVSRAGIDPQPVDLSETAAQLLRMYQETDPHRIVKTSIVKGITVLGDRILLRQLLDNLLGNAWKYTSKKPSSHIEFGVVQLAGEEAFYVRDDGVGFEMQYQKKLFNAFERLHGSEFPGAGIGLATSQRIIKRHGGRIWAKGKVGEGATFFFTLPVYY